MQAMTYRGCQYHTPTIFTRLRDLLTICSTMPVLTCSRGITRFVRIFSQGATRRRCPVSQGKQDVRMREKKKEKDKQMEKDK